MKTQEQIKREREFEKKQSRKVKIMNVSNQRLNINLKTPTGVDPMIGDQTIGLGAKETIDISVGRANVRQLETLRRRGLIKITGNLK